MQYNSDLWWKSLHGPSTLVKTIIEDLNNKKNVIISGKYIPWIDVFYGEFLKESYYDNVDIREIIISDLPKNKTILKYILEDNEIGFQYKGEKNSIKYLEALNTKYTKIYYIKDIEIDRIEELTYLAKNMSQNTKVLIVGNISEETIQGGRLCVKKYSDYVTVNDNVKFLKLLTDMNNYSEIVNSYIAELLGRIEPSLENAVIKLKNYELGKTFDFDNLDDEQKKLVWEAQLITFFPYIEKKRREFIEKYHDKLKLFLPKKDVFGNECTIPEELEVGHIRKLINDNELVIPKREKVDFEKMYNVRNSLAHLKLLDENLIKNF